MCFYLYKNPASGLSLSELLSMMIGNSILLHKRPRRSSKKDVLGSAVGVGALHNAQQSRGTNTNMTNKNSFLLK